MMDHINSYSKASLGNHSPYEVFRMFYGQEILDLLGAHFISPNDITLRPELLKIKNKNTSSTLNSQVHNT